MISIFKRNSIIKLSIMFIILLPSICQADYKFMYGIGLNDCGKLLRAFSQHPHDVSIKVEGSVWPSQSNAYLTWINGYITAFNMHNNQGKNFIIDNDGLAAWMKNYCGGKPEDSVMAATLVMIIEKTGYDFVADKSSKQK